MKAVLISIRPKWVELIASGKKTLEIRKTRPKLETPFKCYIYETKGFERVGNDNLNCVIGGKGRGAVVGEFVCDRIFSIQLTEEGYDYESRKETGMGYEEMAAYLDFETGYGWHISELKMYDEPKKLSEFEKACDHENDCCTCKRFSVNYACINSISRPPQSYMYVEELTDV